MDYGMSANKYRVKITETSSRIVYIEASSEDEAEEIVREKYRNCEIIIDSEDFDDYEIEVVGTVTNEVKEESHAL